MSGALHLTNFQTFQFSHRSLKIMKSMKVRIQLISRGKNER